MWSCVCASTEASRDAERPRWRPWRHGARVQTLHLRKRDEKPWILPGIDGGAHWEGAAVIVRARRRRRRRGNGGEVSVGEEEELGVGVLGLLVLGVDVVEEAELEVV